MALQLENYEFKNIPVEAPYLRAESVLITRQELEVEIKDEEGTSIFDEKTGQPKTEKVVRYVLNGTNKIFTNKESSKDGTGPLENDSIFVEEMSAEVIDPLLAMYYEVLKTKHIDAIDV